MSSKTISFGDQGQKTFSGEITGSEVLASYGVPGLASTAEKDGHAPVVAVLLNKELRSLSSRIRTDSEIEAVRADSAMGAAIYRQSLCFLLACAARQTFAERRIIIGMSIGTSFFYYFDDNSPATETEVALLHKKMRELVALDIPIKTIELSWLKTVEHFRTANQPGALLLLDYINRPSILLNECDGYRDLFTMPLVPSTAMLKVFELRQYKEGLLLRFPSSKTPDVLDPFKDDPLLYSIATETRKKNKVLGTRMVGELNRVNTSRQIKSYVQIAEALQVRRLASIANQIEAQSPMVKAVFIAGPSSSGKTTTAKKLSIELRVLGFEPLTISMDDYFVDRSRTPVDEEGNPDFECLEAVDVEFFNVQLRDLFEGREIELPQYDFKVGKRRFSGKPIRMNPRSIIVVEGIHGLNPGLTPGVDRKQMFQLYVSALTQLNLDDHNRVSTTDNRLLRRLVRDYNYRGRGAQDTIAMWPSVRAGEQKHIFPFSNNAHCAFNSALDYELGVLKVYAEPLLRSVKPNCDEYAEARRLQNFLDNFSPIPAHSVPGDSILREFIGESDFRY